ncbi:HD domain-containing protein [Dendrosporobacter sp. 1207_IL3150]|uniref:HD domain-containing protein n=1 Tax=Dendrosporobacter sp. 1207_IL3150 TaxID=3084054 RepID=UPI002FDAB4EC
MLTRIRQVLSAFTAYINSKDKAFVGKYLTKAEQDLFWGMNLPDQRHSLNVAYTAIKLAEGSAIDRILLIKCALLHDVGKVKGDVSTLDKIITVAAHMIAPEWAKNWGREGRGSKIDNLRHAFYIYFSHPAKSARFLLEAHSGQQVVSIVLQHHKTPAEQDPPELTILRDADNLH